jgi:hypothetical protein
MEITKFFRFSYLSLGSLLFYTVPENLQVELPKYNGHLFCQYQSQANIIN